jgi:predicted methyltransferase
VNKNEKAKPIVPYKSNRFLDLVNKEQNSLLTSDEVDYSVINKTDRFAEVILGDVLKVISKIKQTFEVIITDPPSVGLY